tara:strand:+ start:98 stop:1273 length:1176 start_codon:yes stop_codon:yes gene_type:complete
MAEENKQTDLEEVIQEVEQDGNVTKIKLKDINKEPDVIKVDLSKPPPTNETEESNSDNSGVAGGDESPEPAQEQEEVQQEAEVQGEVPVLEEVTEEAEELVDEAVEAIEEAKATGKPLPENIQKLVDFMEDTGGDINDYVRLNVNVNEMDNQEALREYYKQTKPHLSEEERNFIMDDKFKFDEELDDENNIRKKKIALKEQVAEAKAYLDGQKSKYYEEIKAGSKLTSEQQKAIDFFNRYNKESEQQKQMNNAARSAFDKKTNQVFNDKFKGFDYSVGDKKYRFNVKNANEVKSTQSDINNFVTKFTDDKGVMTDAQAYHKSLFTAMNADAVAQHFYEQGRADATKERIAKDKNIQTEPRKTHGEVNVGGMKIRALGDSSDGLKLKIKKRK